MNPMVLVRVGLEALNDPELKTRLVERPAEVAEFLRLDKDEVEGLAAIGAPGIDVIIGSLIVHRLLPFPVGEKLIIAPVGISLPDQTERKIIWLDQNREGGWIGSDGTSAIKGKAFGSGNHPTTALCLGQLEAHVREGDHVLDLGTGSGVLAIASVLLGAGSVDACDIDPFAAETAAQNVAFNGMQDQIHITNDDLESLFGSVGAKLYDLIISNILGPIHDVNINAGLGRLLRQGGTLIISGFRDEFVQPLHSKLEARGFEVVSVRPLSGWVAITARRL